MSRPVPGPSRMGPVMPGESPGAALRLHAWNGCACAPRRAPGVRPLRPHHPPPSSPSFPQDRARRTSPLPRRRGIPKFPAQPNTTANRRPATQRPTDVRLEHHSIGSVAGGRGAPPAASRPTSDALAASRQPRCRSLGPYLPGTGRNRAPDPAQRSGCRGRGCRRCARCFRQTPRNRPRSRRGRWDRIIGKGEGRGTQRPRVAPRACLHAPGAETRPLHPAGGCAA